MEQQPLTISEAWADFWQWIHAPAQAAVWQAISRREKQYIGKAAIAARAGRLGYERTKNILTRYAPGRYEFRAVVFLNK